MLLVYPPIGTKGWHCELGWHWEWFSLGFGIGWREHVVVNLGFLHLMVWNFDGHFTR
jgi:hypothetical protein